MEFDDGCEKMNIVFLTMRQVTQVIISDGDKCIIDAIEEGRANGSFPNVYHLLCYWHTITLALKKNVNFPSKTLVRSQTLGLLRR